MPCFAPLLGYRSRSPSSSGKVPIVFNVAKGYADLPVTVPCGQCVGCRLERSRQWAIRCMHEASLYERNCFITLTYADEYLPHGGTLVKSDFQKFMKRLRRRFPRESIRFFHCGEYGARGGRPHYHCCLFGFDFSDKYPWTVRKGFPVWRSEVLESLWPWGQSEIGTVTFESAAYVARYILKKVTGEEAREHYESLVEETGEVVDRAREYTTMSRRPGIGRGWFDKFGSEVYPADSVIVRGREMKPPKYYDGLHELLDMPGALDVARERRRSRRLEDETPERLAVREKVSRARLERSERKLECED